ncbi:MAG TPA: twin-arginine translocation pathway signal protein [Verrucomicrobiales bacterium]|nr:twin-arginine translocation pathway signal protein [Verrucomicrobiales bacterium]
MTNKFRFIRTTLLCLWASLAMLGAGVAGAASGPQIDMEVQAALKTLYASSPTAKALGDRATGILVFPKIVKAGFVIGGQDGDGALLKRGKRVAYYNAAALSVGLQAGVQSFAFAIFFMRDADMEAFEKSNGFEIGVGPSIVVLDSGAGQDINTLTSKSDVYAFVYGQTGLMAGVGLQGTKITKVDR